MHRYCALLIAAFLCAIWHAPASASADYGCDPSWKLAHSDLSGCDNIAILGPGNDTRVNLTMLLLDSAGDRQKAAVSQEPLEALFDWRTFKDHLSPGREDAVATSFAEGEGSRCRTNIAGAQEYEAAIKAARKVPEEEHILLIGARRALQPSCAGASEGAEAVAEALAQIRSRDGQAFAAYLQGALAFYDGDYDAASAHFSSLRNAAQSWLKESARYMLARAEVNRAQVDAFDEYGYPRGPEQADQKVIDAAEAGLLAYIRDYPRGRYTRSARGLLRRVYWLGGRTDKLTAQYVASFAVHPAQRGETDAELAEEIDNKLLPILKPADTNDSTLLAVLDLMRMRPCDGCSAPRIGLQDLEAQRRHFAGNPALFDYLVAAYAFHVANQPDEVLRLIPEAKAKARFNNLEFSRQMLRRMALAKIEDRLAGGANAWTEMLPGAQLPFQRGALELAIAMYYERNNAIGRVFEAGSPVQSQILRETLLINVADAQLLRTQATDARARQHERETALFTLLYKELSRGAYRDFITDLTLVPTDASTDGGYYNLVQVDRVPVGIFTLAKGSEDFACPPLKQTALRLSNDPRDIKAQLCLADFMRLNGFDYNELDRQPPKDELGGTPTLFKAHPYARLEVYKAIIADPKGAATDKSYALYRAVHCYGPTGSNSCGGIEVPMEQRRAWFQRLKKDYPETGWAKALKYYW